MNKCQSDYWELLTALKSASTTETASSFLKKYYEIDDKCGHSKLSYRLPYIWNNDVAFQVMNIYMYSIEADMLSRMPLKQRIIYRLPTISYKTGIDDIQIVIERNNNGKKIIENSTTL